MKPFSTFCLQTLKRHAALATVLRAAAVFALMPALFAQGSPWEQAVANLRDSFTGPIARGLSLVAIVVGGLMFAFGEGDSKRMLAGIVFGVGMAIGAVNFMAWLFP
jgi:type IV secretory pathway VirB2 component (pilin)